MANLGVPVALSVADIDEVMEDWTSIRLYRATAQNGSFSLITTITLVADQTAYTYQDESGTSASWYKTSYYDTGDSSESSLTEAFPALQAPAVTRAALVQMVADRVNCYGKPAGDFTFPGVSGTTTGNGNGGGTTVVCSTYAASGYGTRAFRHWYLRLTSGSYSGQERRITSFDETTGTFTVDRAYGGQVASSVTFELYRVKPGDFWRQMLNDSLLDIWTPFELPIGGIANQTQYALPAYIEDRAQILGLFRETGDTLRQKRFVGGHDFLVMPQEGGGVVAYIESGLAANSTWRLTGYRHPAKLFADTDTLIISEQNQRLLTLTAAARACDRIWPTFGALPEDMSQWKGLRDELERQRQGEVRERGTFGVLRSPRQSQIVSVRSGWR